MSPQTENQKGGMVFKVLTIVFAVAIAALIFWSLSTKKRIKRPFGRKRKPKIRA